ncbi:MAG: ATP-binding protein [Bacteroidetes bacterium]|nr:MAG: ATP-binding protein [Bacteroidota bacterium]
MNKPSLYMNPTEQAHFFLRNARYADFFKLMQLNEIEIPQLALLRMEFEQGNWEFLFPQRIDVFFKDIEVELTKVLPADQMTATAQILSKFYFPTGAFIGRKQELQDLHASLQKNLPTVLVNGLGGIGKTRLAKEYIRRHLDKYAHVVWVEQTTSAVEAFISDATLLESLGRTFEKETEQERFDLVLSDLKKRGGTNLLVLDNYQRPDNEEDFDVISYLLFSPNWRVLITSRESIMDFETLELDILSEEEAMMLFKLHAGKKPVDDNELQDLLKTIEYHTLMIELLAKNYSRNILLKSIADFAGKIAEREIDDEALQRLVRVAHSDKEIRLYKHLLRVFSLGKLDSKALHLLKQVAVLPAEPIFIVLILKTKEEEQDVYSMSLEDLEQKGWVSFINYEEVQMHRLIQTVILKMTEPTYQDCKMLCKLIINALSYNRVRANPMEWQWASEYAESLLIHVDFQEILEKKIILQGNLGNFYSLSGNYQKGVIVSMNNLILAEDVYGKIHQEYAACLHNLAFSYDNIGLYDKSLPLYKEVLKIREKTIGKEHINYINTLNSIGSLYCYLQEYDKAITFLEEGINITAKTVGKKHEMYANNLGNLAIVYDNLKQYDKVLPLYEEVLQIRKQIVGKEHPDYATALHNIASWYTSQKMFGKALLLYQEILSIYANTLGKEHPDYATALHNIAFWYTKQERFEEALSFYQETLSIYANTLGKQHPRYAMSIYYLGGCLIALQRIEEGIQAMYIAYQILFEGVGEAHPYTQQVGRDLTNIIEMKEKMGL